jgi:hypothetical protein
MWHGVTDLHPCRLAAGSWRRATRAGAGNRLLPPHQMRRQEPDAVGYGARCTFVENFDSKIYFSKIITN